MSTASKGLRAHLPAALAACAAMGVYLATLARDITGEDSGELIAAAYTAGIPHPPGYPLWTLIAHLFTLLPFGTVPLRVHLFSGLCAAAAVYITVLLLIRWTGRPLIACAAGLTLAFGRVFWEHAVIAEVYTLNVFCIALCVYLLARWREEEQPFCLYAFGLVYGLSLGNHSTMIVIAPLFIIYIVEKLNRGARPMWSAAITVGCAALGACVYLYLPLRSLADPAMDWGNPETWDNFWRVVRREQFAFMYSETPRSAGRFLGQLAAMARMWGAEFSIPIAIAGVGGIALLVKRRPWEGTLLAAVAIVVPVAAAWVQNFDMDREWLSVMRVFGLPAYWVTALGLGFLLARLAERRPRMAKCAAALAVFCAATPLLLHWQHNDKSGYFWARAYGEDLLAQLPQDAIYIPDSDDATFTVAYLQDVEGMRPDVLLGNKYGYPEAAVLDMMPNSLRELVGEFPLGREDGVVYNEVLHNNRRPVYFERIPYLPPGYGIRIEAQGFLYRALRTGEDAPAPGDWPTFPWEAHLDDDVSGDHTAATILFKFALAKLRATRDAEAAARWAEAALDVYGREAISLTVTGVSAARARHYGLARDCFEEALQRDPDYAPARENLERVKGLLAE